MESFIQFHTQARASLAAGAEKTAAFLQPAFGPAGRDALVDRDFHVQLHTNDGCSILKQITLADPFEQQSVRILKEVADRTRRLAGGGGTRAVLLAAELMKTGECCIEAGYNSVLLQKGMKRAAAEAEAAIRRKTLQENSREAIINLAAAAAGSKKTGELIWAAVERAGKNTVIMIEENIGNQTETEITRGIRFDRGYISPYLANNRHRLCAEFQDAYLLITDLTISDFGKILPLLEAVKSSGRPLLIIAEDVTADALSNLIANSIRGVLNVSAVRAPGYGLETYGLLEDIAVYTGGTYISREQGGRLSDISLQSLGSARRIRVEPDRTMIENGAGAKKAVEDRLRLLFSQLEKESDGFERIRLQRRIAALSEETVRIKVGAVLQTEAKEQKKRYEDALSAVYAAKEEGVVYGAASAYVHAAKEVRGFLLQEPLTADELQGVRIMTDALEKPLHTIVENAGQNADLAVAAVRDAAWNFGYDIRKEQLVDLELAGMYEPVKILCTALAVAVSAAAAFLGCEAVLVKKYAPAPGILPPDIKKSPAKAGDKKIAEEGFEPPTPRV